jgi:hypothetical protein
MLLFTLQPNRPDGRMLPSGLIRIGKKQRSHGILSPSRGLVLPYGLIGIGKKSRSIREPGTD